MTMDGLLLVDKASGCTSHDVVRAARRALGQRKVGHCGTLDPDATGLLLLTLGRGTRLTRFLIRAPKVYSGVIRFGVSTDTYDGAGTVTAERDASELTLEAVESALAGFVNTFGQLPPPYCAKKVGGQKYYELARRGEEVPREAKTVTVYELEATGPLRDARLPFRLSCSSGTYARSLAHDLGETLGVGGHLASLRRTQIGPFKVEDALPIEQIDALSKDGGPQALGPAFVPFDAIPLPFGEVAADQLQERRIVHGQTVLVPQLESEAGDWVKVMNGRRQLIAVGTVVERIGERGAGVVQPRIVFK
jgi:tRNA pseudouridine55 synthase